MFGGELDEITWSRIEEGTRGLRRCEALQLELIGGQSTRRQEDPLSNHRLGLCTGHLNGS